MHNSSTALSISDLSEHHDISRQAITRHLDVLHDAALVTFSVKGRERYCFLRPDALKLASVWLSQFDGGIQRMLDDFTS